MSLVTVLISFVPAYYDTTIDQVERFRALNRDTSTDTTNRNIEEGAAGLGEIEPEAAVCGRTYVTGRDGVSQLEGTEEKCQAGSQDLMHILFSRPFAKTLLKSLSDLQTFTATAIMIAAFAQRNSISFYHEQFVLQYWWCAFQSFWVAREGSICYQSGKDATFNSWLRRLKEASPQLPQDGARITFLSRIFQYRKYCFWGFIGTFLWDKQPFGVWFRRLIVCCCTVLFNIFYWTTLQREKAQWDSGTPGKCYFIHDSSTGQSSWFWLASTIAYNMTLFASLVGGMKYAIDHCSEWFYEQENAVFRACIREWVVCQGVFYAKPNVLTCIMGVGKLCLSVLRALLFSAFFQFLSIWSFGRGFYVLEVAFYMGMWIWGLWRIVDLKWSNKDLLQEWEGFWAFGQVLPVVLMGMVIFSAIDAFQGRCARYKSQIEQTRSNKR